MNNSVKWLSSLVGSRSAGVRINKLNCGLLAFLFFFKQVPRRWLKLGNGRFISTSFPIHYLIIILSFVVTRTYPKVPQPSLNVTTINIMTQHSRNCTLNALIKLEADSKRSGMHLCEFIWRLLWRIGSRREVQFLCEIH
jgi:hypothetical protein